MASSDRVFQRLRVGADGARLLIRVFYALNLFFWLMYLRNWGPGLDRLVVIEPVWTVFWLDTGNASFWAKTLLALNGAGALAAAIWPDRRAARFAAFAGLLFFTAVQASDASGWERMNHHGYAYVLIAFLFLFLPAGGSRRADRSTVLLFSLAQKTLLCGYVASAVWRLREAAALAWAGAGPSPIGPLGLKRFIENYALFTGRGGPLGRFLHEHDGLTAGMMALATAFELLALLAICQDRWIRAYGLLLIGFQTMLILGLNVGFDEHFALVLVLLVCSPLPRPRARA